MSKLISIKKLLQMSIATIILGSCTPTTIVRSYDGYKSIKGTENVLYTPTIADLDVKPDKIEGTFVGDLGTLEFIKENAISDALRKSKADVMVEPRYEILNSLDRTTVNVTGYAAYYKNFRNADTLSLALIKKGLGVMYSVVTPVKSTIFTQQPTAKPSNTGKTILITLGVIFGIGLFIGVMAALISAVS